MTSHFHRKFDDNDDDRDDDDCNDSGNDYTDEDENGIATSAGQQTVWSEIVRRNRCLTGNIFYATLLLFFGSVNYVAEFEKN